MDIVLFDLNSHPTTISRKRLTNEQRQAIYEMLLQKSDNGHLMRDSVSKVAAEFSVHKTTVRRIWKQAKECIINGTWSNVSNNLSGRVGRKRIQIDPLKVSEIPLRKRTTIRSMSYALGMPKSTLQRRIAEGCLRAHSNAIKPALTEENKRARLRFCLSMLEPERSGNNPRFQNMFNYVHIDEKWFFLTKELQKYYLLPNEDEPLRSCKSKKYIPKVMFLTAVARPRYDFLSNQEFSGKIGIFPFTYKEAAKRKSKNRAAGTLETKPIASITREVIRECLIKEVLPAIRAKWPLDGRAYPILIQQDNARPHINSSDEEFMQAASSEGFDIRLCCQPPNSPDLNVLDLGFFNAIQSLQYQEAPTTIDELLEAVQVAFDKQSTENLNAVFLTMQSCMVEIMKVDGGNRYAIPHMGKKHMRREGTLQLQLEVYTELIENVRQYLEQ